jgi:16S rRNA (uracil1498-N3)-methyltransferase
VNLLLVEATELSNGTITLDDQRAQHLREVLQVRVGSVVRVGCIDGPVGSAEVEAIEGARVRLVCTLEGERPPVPKVDVLMALPRPKVLRRLWAQLAALGVGTVVLTNANRVERYYFDSHVVRLEEVRPHLLEGLAQARDTRVPRVEVRRAFKPLVEDELDALFGPARRLVCDPTYDRSILRSASSSERVVLALGPEGGWSAYERELLEGHGFIGVGLGARTLRSDTAAVALVALAHETLRR